ncbi:MAG: hypothetical protein RMA76_26735 [Deltaproteobacteria bacterium]|jgi:pyrroloquinoline quinone (PQQ) biosynthesis protein C
MEGTMIEAYAARVAGVRERLRSCATTKRLCDPDLDPDVFLRWLIEFSSYGVQNTKPVVRWMTQAGEHMMAQGFEEIGAAFKAHGKHEGGHDELMVADTHRLVARWNAKHGDSLDAEALINRPPTPSVQLYVDLHEDLAAGDRPWRNLAIAREIEGVATTIGPMVLDQCRRVLGEEGMKEVSFIVDHVELDVGHTASDDKMIDRLLTKRPELLDEMAERGEVTLDAYIGFLEECFIEADAWVERQRAA